MNQTCLVSMPLLYWQSRLRVHIFRPLGFCEELIVVCTNSRLSGRVHSVYEHTSTASAYYWCARKRCAPLYIEYGVSWRGKGHQSGGMRVNLSAPFRQKACNVDLIPSSVLHRDRTVSEASPVRNRDELALTRMIQCTSLTDATYSVTT